MKILLIEDEPSIAAFIVEGFTENGDEIVHVGNGKLGLQVALKDSFDVIILDIILPEMDGRKVCKQLRMQKNTTPILMLSALGSTDDVVLGLDIGADDYLTKPFKFAELSARVKALLRRKQGITYAILKFADVEMNLEAKTVHRAGIAIKLTAKEFKLLEYFLRNPGKVISRLTLLEKVWDLDFDTGTNVVDVYIKYLRNKIDKDQDVKLIHTLIGMGYVLKDITE